MYHLRRIKSLVLLLLVCVVAKAQPEAGKIYRFVNKANLEQSLAVVSETKSSVNPTADHYLQYWLLETHPGNASTWTLRNLGNGKYLQRAGRSVFWGFVDAASDATPLYYLTQDGYCTFSSANNVNDGACMHYASSQGGIVGWDFSADATQWTMTEISSVTADDLTANWEALDEFNKAYDDDMAKDCASALDALFADAACTTLESTYASMSVSAIQEDANYKALPAALQELVLKVRNGVWTEANFVDGKAEWESDQAKKFRVQLYEPHSIAGDITGWLGINAHNNMDNPTGIFADCRDVVYVMVEGTIKEGASLYLYGLRGHGQMGSYNDDNAVQLHEGLNVVPYISDGNALWINYVVDTYNGNGSTDEERFQYKLSSYDPLKINIAGGHINGYYNAVGDALWGGPDDDTDWAYYKDRASLESFTLLSHRVTMQFYMYTTNGSPGLDNLLDNIAVPENPYCFSGTKGTSATFSQYEGMGLDASTGKINIMLEAWNRIAYSQFATLGVLDAATIDKMNEKYPRWYNNWTERGKIYDYTTGNDGQSYKEYCGGVDYSEYFNHHCLAISNTTGYMSGGWKSSNYNINTAESIIDKIANEAGPVWGPAHEIGHQHQELFTLNGLTEVTNNLHSNVAVWYMGMGTSRVNGTEGSLASVLAAFNTEGSDYYTNNIWGLTQMYYRLWLYYHLAGNNTQFYPRLMENLRREPLEKGYNVGPGGLLRFYKHCCVAAGEDLTEFFRAHGLLSVMTDRFVGDYSNSVYNQSQEQIDAAIAEVKALGLPVNIAPLFISDATPDVTYGHDGTTQRSYWDGNSTISGNNAEVGSYIDFIDSEAIGTAPTLTIEGTTVTIDGLDGVGIAIFNEKGEIVGFSTKSTFELSEECAALLASGEATVKAVNADNSTVQIEVTDPTQIKYDLLGSLLDEVNSMLALSDDTNTKLGWYRPSALEALDAAYTKAKEVYDERDVNSYTAAYDMLKIAYDEVRNNADAVISLKTGLGYAYRLVNKAYPVLSMSIDANKAMLGEETDEKSDAQRWYFEKSATEGSYYIKNKSTQTYPGNVGTGAVLSATATSTTDAHAYALRSKGNGLWALVGATGLHCSASQSYNIVGWGDDAEASQWYITAVEVDQNAECLHELQTLIEKTESLVDEMATVDGKGTIDMSTCSITSNATETGHETKYLTDGNPNTFFHTVWSGSVVNDYHNIVIDLGEGHSLAEFVLNYTTLPTSAYNVDAPKSMIVSGSNDGSSYSTITTLSGLPTDKGAEYTSSTLGSASQAYRYIRLQVTDATGGKLGEYKYFGLAELNLLRMTTLVDAIGDKYQKFITANELKVACDQVYAAQQTIASGYANSNDVEALQTQYDILLEAHQKANNLALTAKKAELQTLINDMTSLISSCGTVTYTPATLNGALALQTTNSEGGFYLSTNAQEPNEGPIKNLLTSENTYFHSKWSAAVGAVHHLEVDMGEGYSLKDFTFTYKTSNGLFPYIINVYGSNDTNDTGTLLYEISKDDNSNALPNEASRSWTSSTISSDTRYRYIRFDVVESGGGGLDPTPTGATSGTEYCFKMSYFGLTAIGTPESYTVELGNDAGGATNALMLAAYKENASAQATHTLGTTLSQVEAAIANLQADYDALKSAKETIVEKTYYIQVVGGNANGGVVYGGNSYLSSASFEAPINLTVADLTAIPLDGYAEPVVTLNGTTITVTYNKVYTVQVDGDDDTGGVIYDNNNYLNGSTITVLQDIDAAQLAAIAVSGYNGVEVTLNGTTITVTYRKVYTVQVAGVQDAGGVSFGGNDYAHNATITVLQDIDEAQLTAKDVEGYDAGVITVNHETKVITVPYTMTPLVATEKFYTLECLSEYAHSTKRFISDNGTVINGRSAEGSLFQFEAADDDNGYYIKSYVSDKYLNCTANENTGNDAVVESKQKSTVWKMAKHTEGVVTLTAGHDKYLNNNGDAPTYLLARYHNGGPASNNACSLWTLTEGTPLDKSVLNTLIGETNTLIESCYTDEEFDYAGSLNVTEELMTATREAVTVAQEKYDSKATTESEYEAALNALQTAKDNLQTAINYANLPVQLTFDANNPVTYKIMIARANTPVLAYDESNSMVAVTTFELGNKSHGWYFMATTDGKVRIIPYHNTNTTLALSTNDFNGGNSKVKGMAIGAEGYTQDWTISNTSMNDANRNAGWYNITTINPSNTETTWYFSNHGGVANKMGFYNDADDDGSRFQFEKISFDKSKAYYTLYNYYHNDTKVKSGTITGGAGVGYYPETEATAYNTAYSNAEQTLKSAMATDEEYANAYNDLKAANEALELIMPEEDKFYRFVSVVKGNGTNAYVYANPADNKMYWGEGKANNDATTMWTITPTANGKYSVTNLHTGSSINTFIYYDPTPLSETAGEVSIVSLSANDGQIGIKCGDRMMHAQGGENAIVHWDTGANDGSAWRIVEVTNEEVNLVEFALTIGQYRHASLYLNYATKIPAGVKVFVAHTPNGDDGTVVAEELIGATILPANTGVIVQGDAGTYGFKYTIDGYNGDEPTLLDDNRLGGSAYLKYQQVAKEGNRCCVFGRKGNEVGLYKNYIEYIDANGSQTRTVGEGESATSESFVDTDKGTHFMIPANKIYFEYDPSAVSNASAFRFRFNSKAEGTTAIDELFLGGDAIIYNLYGQRIVEIVEPGIYIINGKKIYVSEKMILNNE